MRNDLKIYHRGLKGGANDLFIPEPGFVSWNTCVRSLLIGTEATGGVRQVHDEAFRGGEALSFLTEVVAGLKSPMVGETEVHGQFKDLLESMGPGVCPKIRKDLFAVHFLARQVRANYLKNLGCQSYGSYARKKMRELSQVCILGAGRLALEMIPWLIKNRSQTVLVSRKPEKVHSEFKGFDNLEVIDYNCVPVGAMGLIVTAPLKAEQIQKLFPHEAPLLTLDLRAESRKDPLGDNFNAMALDDVFSEIEQRKTYAQAKIDMARGYIQKALHDLDSVVGRHLRSLKIQ